MSQLLKMMHRRGFFARLLGLAVIPVAAKVAAAQRVIGDTETSRPFLGCIIDRIPYGEAKSQGMLDEAEATALARAWMKGRFRIEPTMPHGIVYGYHPLSDYFFFWVDRGELDIGASETIAVCKSDGRVSHCGWIGE